MLRDGSAERIPGQAVTWQFFDVLRVAPVAGRAFTAADTAAPHVALISERLWRSHFAADPSAIGRSVRLDDEPYTIIGIVPAGFEIMFPSDLWTLFVPKRSPEQRRMHYLQVVGRLANEASLPSAQTDMRALADRIASIAPDTNKDWSIRVEPLRDAIVSDDLKTTSLVLGGAVTLVLLMACANVASLLIARGAGRARELAVRAALGGSRRRLIRQLLAETGLLAAAGGIVGLAIAWAAVRLAPSFLPPDTLPSSVRLSFDWRLAAFAAGLTVATALMAGLAPAWQSARVSLTDVLKRAGRTSTGAGSRLRVVLTVGEIATAVLLVCGATLLLRSFTAMNRTDAPLASSDVLTMQVSLPLARYRAPEDTLRFYREAVRGIEALPGVRAAAFGGALPFDGFEIGQGFEIVGDPPIERSQQRAVHYQIVGAHYFDALGLPLLAGRAFGVEDVAGSLPVCIVSQDFVTTYANGRNPVGLRIQVAAMDPAGPRMVERTVVGVVPFVSETAGRTEQRPALYVPLEQNPWYSASLSVRSSSGAGTMLPAIKAAVARADKDQPVTRVRTMAEVADESIAVPRFRAQLVGAFAVSALALAGIGVFGVLAFAVHQRTREFGIRIALGAQRRDVLGLVMRQGLAMTGTGIALGLLGATALTRTVAALLFSVEPLDAASFVAAPVVLAATALAACAVPAWRAARVDAAVALRQD
jgi:putative ABC transport system permease protein